MAQGVEERLRAVRRRIGEATARASRDPEGVRLVGASKRQPLERLREAHDAGLRLFGENQVQEGFEHAAALAKDIEWHLIGPLQSNKANRAVRLFTTVQSVDRLKIARTLDRAAAEQKRVLDGFLEVNLGQEESKHGFTPSELTGLAKSAELAELEHLRIVGLMAIPPPTPTAEAARPFFRRLRELREELFSQPAWYDRPGYLSMGMSGDFEVAIEEGATHIRVGSSLFGPRPR